MVRRGGRENKHALVTVECSALGKCFKSHISSVRGKFSHFTDKETNKTFILRVADTKTCYFNLIPLEKLALDEEEGTLIP